MCVLDQGWDALLCLHVQFYVIASLQLHTHAYSWLHPLSKMHDVLNLAGFLSHMFYIILSALENQKKSLLGYFNATQLRRSLRGWESSLEACLPNVDEQNSNTLPHCTKIWKFLSKSLYLLHLWSDSYPNCTPFHCFRCRTCQQKLLRPVHVQCCFQVQATLRHMGTERPLPHGEVFGLQSHSRQLCEISPVRPVLFQATLFGKPGENPALMVRSPQESNHILGEHLLSFTSQIPLFLRA